jgi:hypothetical protein
MKNQSHLPPRLNKNDTIPAPAVISKGLLNGPYRQDINRNPKKTAVALGIRSLNGYCLRFA